MRFRNVLILGVGQALAMTGVAVVTLVGGLVGTELAADPAWATLPVASTVIGVAVASVPAALLMNRIGRRWGFVAAALMAAVASLGAAYAISISSFTLFCTATFFIGANAAFVQQYRFAAAESVSAQYVGRAVSFVLLGGVVAGYLGPEVAQRSRDWLVYGAYTGSFASAAAIYVVAAVVLLLVRDVAVVDEAAGAARPLRDVITQPTFVVAALAAAVAYGVMTAIMTATPISMHVIDGFSLTETTRVVQSHIMAMYLPSLATGYILARVDATKVMQVGIALLLACVMVALLARQLLNYWVALALLGVGWNLLFVGGTVLLTDSYRPAERFKVQAVNDFLVFGSRTLASLSAGTVIFRANWEVLIWLNVPILVVMLVAIVALGRHRTHLAASTAPT